MNPISSRILQIMVVKSQELGFSLFLYFLLFFGACNISRNNPAKSSGPGLILKMKGWVWNIDNDWEVIRAAVSYSVTLLSSKNTITFVIITQFLFSISSLVMDRIKKINIFLGKHSNI